MVFTKAEEAPFSGLKELKEARPIAKRRKRK